MENKQEEQKLDQQQQQQIEQQKKIENQEEILDTHLNLLKLLDSKKINYKLTEHKAVLTSQEAADIRGATLASGAKAMLLKDGKTNVFMLCVMSAARKISWKLVKTVLNSKKLSLANEQDVFTITKCRPGAVPPFGSVFNVKTYLDQSLIDQGTTINFNCGLRTKSIQMQTQDYVNTEEPSICQITE